VGDAIEISVTIAGLSMLFGDDLSAVIDVARQAEDAGVAQLAVPDHVAIGARTDRYPYGRFPLPKEEPWLEPLTTLAAMAATTSKIRLATGILIVPLRPAPLLAKMLATLDVLSKGRIDLGVGTGWQREEYQSSGGPFEGRTRRMEDTLRACRVLWSEAPASFMSKTVSFESLWSLPRPVQEGGIPIWIGGALTPGNLRRLVEFGSGWMPMESSLDDLREGRATIDAALRAAGREPGSVRIRGHVSPVRSGREIDLERTLEQLPPLAEAGADQASFALGGFVRSRDEIGPFFERIAGAAA
jgi:probable F420-dependent oxidoreductase